jgi:hypothetical protein
MRLFIIGFTTLMSDSMPQTTSTFGDGLNPNHKNGQSLGTVAFGLPQKDRPG